MSNWKTYRALLMSILVFGASRLDAGSMTPYQALVFHPRLFEDPPGQDSVLIVDMDTGERIEIPVETPGTTVQGPGTMAVDAEGAIYVYYGFCSLPPPDIGQGSLMARLDPSLSEWTSTVFRSAIDYPDSLQFRPNGNLIVNGELGVYDIDLHTQTIRPSGLHLGGNTEGIQEGGAYALRVDASDAITAVFLSDPFAVPVKSIIFHQPPEAEVAERWEPEVVLGDFVTDLDGSLIGTVQVDNHLDPLDTATLYRLDFDTRTLDVLFESELLKGGGPIELDPEGRIVALVANGLPSASIVRVDLEQGTAEVIANVDRFSGDLDLRMVPEPESALLLILGCLCLSACLRRGNRPAIASDGRRRSVCCETAVPENASNPPVRRRRSDANA